MSLFIVIKINKRVKGIEEKLDSTRPQQPKPSSHAVEAELPPPKPPQTTPKSQAPKKQEPPTQQEQAGGKQTPAVGGKPPEAAMPPNSYPASGDNANHPVK